MSATERLSMAALLLRVGMGVMFVAHGLVLKVFLYTPSGTAEYFVSIGYPAATAYLVIAAEVVGGLMLIAGYQVRLASLMLVPNMIGATVEHLGNGWLFSNAGGVCNTSWPFRVFAMSRGKRVKTQTVPRKLAAETAPENLPQRGRHR